MKKQKRAIAGRSWLRGEVTLDEVRGLTKRFGVQPGALFDDDSMEGSTYDVVVVDRALDIAGDFSSFHAGLCGLVVRGDFTVGGVYSDCDDPATGVFVLGDMRAGSVHTNGALGVSGSLETDGPLVGFYNDYSAMIQRDVKTPCFVPENHFFDIGGKLAAGAVIGRGAEYRVPPRLRKSIELLAPEKYRDVLRSEVLEGSAPDEVPELAYSALQRRVLDGKPVLVSASKRNGERKTGRARHRPDRKPKRSAR